MTRTTYLCRRCATAFAAESSDLDPESEIQRRIAAPTKAARMRVHACGAGAFGVADLTGAIDMMPAAEFSKLTEKT